MPVRDLNAVQLCPERDSGALEMMEEEYNEHNEYFQASKQHWL